MSGKATSKVSAAVMTSRVLGLGREMLFAGLFGGSRWMDCFYLAFKVPNLLRDMFAEGALSHAFVTTFSKKLKVEGDQSAWQLANKMVTLLAVFMSLIVLVGIGMAPWIVEALTILARSTATKRDFDQEQIELTVLMVRVMYPFILLVSMASLAMGMLNAKSIFGVPALSSCFFNLGSMIGGLAIGYWLDPTWGKNSLIGFAIGVLIGGLAQLVCQFPALWKVGYRFVADFRWKDSGVRQVLRLMAPAVVATSVVQVNVAINAMFAVGVSEGAVSWLTFAFRIMQLPIGVFGVAVATVTLPALSRAATHEVGADFRDILARGLRLICFLVVPATVGLVVLSDSIVSVLYERGKFGEVDRMQTAAAMRAYGYGLVCYAALKALQPAFYAMDRRWVPMLLSLFSLGVNFGFNWFFVVVMKLGHEWLALTTSISVTLNFLILYVVMRRMAGDIRSGELMLLLAKLAVAAGVMGALCTLARVMWLSDPGAVPILWRFLLLMAMVGGGAAVYFLMAHLLKIEEARDALAWVKERIGR